MLKFSKSLAIGLISLGASVAHAEGLSYNYIEIALQDEEHYDQPSKGVSFAGSFAPIEYVFFQAEFTGRVTDDEYPSGSGGETDVVLESIRSLRAGVRLPVTSLNDVVATAEKVDSTIELGDMELDYDYEIYRLGTRALLWPTVELNTYIVHVKYDGADDATGSEVGARWNFAGESSMGIEFTDVEEQKIIKVSFRYSF